MGFDITYHPVRIDEMNSWFFEPVKAMKDGDESILKSVIEAQGEGFFDEKYEFIIKDIASRYTEFPSEKGILYAMAACIGLFRKYQYVRGSAFSFLIERAPEMDKYRTPWAEVIPSWVPVPGSDTITENYSSGVFIGPDKVKELLADIENEEKVHSAILDAFGEANLGVFIKSLQDAASTDSGVMEATEIMEVNPFDLNNSSCNSDIMNCDPEGALIYQEVAMEQVKEATGMNENEIAENVVYQKTNTELPSGNSNDENVDKPKKGLLSRLLKRK